MADRALAQRLFAEIQQRGPVRPIDAASVALVRQHMARHLPMVGWRFYQADPEYGYAAISADGLQVIVSGNREDDGRVWLHVSASRKRGSQVPSYDDIQRVRRLFVGEDRYCYQVFPPKATYVNIGQVLHLWTCLEAEQGRVLPEFSATVAGVRTV